MKNILRIFFLCALLPWVAHAQFVPGVGASGTSAGSVSGSGGGGGGTPAGSNGDFQINSGGSFGAVTPGTGVATAFANATNGTGGFVTFSGNIGAATGTSLTLSGAGAAGYVELTQGTAPSAGTTSIKLYAPASVTSYIRTFEGSAGSTGYYKGTVSGTTVTDSKVATIPAADVASGALANGMTATTQSAGSADTKVATDAYADVAARATALGTFASPNTAAGAITWTAPVYTIFTSAGATRTYTLPAASSYTGQAVILYVAVGTGHVNFQPASGAQLVLAGVLLTANHYIQAATSAPGNYICLISDGTNWISLGYSGTWADASSA